jgi:arylsulfatase A-like enzyme
MWPNILFIVLDTVRADALSCYGNPKLTTPNLDEVADHGVLFKNAFSSSSWTLPAHASMFTGVYPSEHGANQENLKLSHNFPTIASLLQDKNYTTIGLSSNDWLRRDHGMDQGFEIFLEKEAFRHSLPWRVLNRLSGYRLYREGIIRRRTPRQLETAFELIQEEHSPFFMFINLMDAHLPYHPAPFFRHFVEGEYRDRMWKVNQEPARYLTGLCEMSPEDFRILKGLYLGEVAGMDTEIGGFLDKLQDVGLDDNLVVIITSDHGENIGEHNLMDHQLCLYDTLLHVPLIIWGKGVPEGIVIDDMVSLNSLFTTIYELALGDHSDLRQDFPPSLCACWSQVSEYNVKHIFAEAAYPHMYLKRLSRYNPGADLGKWTRSQRCVRSSRYKYIVSGNGDRELFDLEDIGEEKNLLAEHKLTDVAADLEGELAMWEQSLTISRYGESLLYEDLDDTVRKRLESLGYL